MSPIDPSLAKKMLFSTLELKLNRCLEPTYKCTNTAIRAHSVQNAVVMQLLQRDGHVKMLSINRRNTNFPEVIWTDVGRNLATTFEGFCSSHDSMIFKPIDIRPISVGDSEQQFLYAYRAIARELHQLMEAAVRTQSLYQQRIDAGIDKGNEPELAGMLAVEHMLNSHSTYVYKSELDEALLRGDFSILHHDVVRLTNQRPTVAASVFFDMDTRPYDDERPRIALNIFPVSNDETIAMFSYNKKDAEPAHDYITPILTSSHQYQKYLISRMLLMHAENFVVAPAHFSAWNEAKRDSIRNFFLKTARFNNEEHSENFYLF